VTLLIVDKNQFRYLVANLYNGRVITLLKILIDINKVKSK